MMGLLNGGASLRSQVRLRQAGSAAGPGPGVEACRGELASWEREAAGSDGAGPRDVKTGGGVSQLKVISRSTASRQDPDDLRGADRFPALRAKANFRVLSFCLSRQETFGQRLGTCLSCLSILAMPLAPFCSLAENGPALG